MGTVKEWQHESHLDVGNARLRRSRRYAAAAELYCNGLQHPDLDLLAACPICVKKEM